MTMVKLIKFSRTPVWVPVVAAALGLTVAAVHRSDAGTSLRDLVTDVGGNGFGEYLIVSMVFFGLFWLLLHRFFKQRQLSRRRWPRLSQVSRELLFSFCAQFTMLGVGAWLAFGETAMNANMYLKIADYGWVYFTAVTFLLFAVDDTIFYWTHRAMHHPRLFRTFHRVHHESTDPTPFTSYSFHPLEAAVQAIGPLALIPLLMVLPWHPIALVIYAFGNLLFNMIGHLGYEVYPANWNRIPVLRWKTPALHHYLHHQVVGGNYALYFRWWDKWCGTEIKDFEARYDRIFAPANGAKTGGLNSAFVTAAHAPVDLISR
jgi:Delta7-sterol 5-desaturase